MAIKQDLFIKGGLPDCIFNPLHRWRIDYEDAVFLIHNLRLMIKYDHEDMKDEICQNLLGKNVFQTPTKTVDEFEEESLELATFDLPAEDCLDPQIYRDDVSQNIWIHEWNEEMFAEIVTRVGALVKAAPEIAEMDLNPLLGKADKVVAVDARIRIEK